MKCYMRPLLDFDVIIASLDNIDKVKEFLGSRYFVPSDLVEEYKNMSDKEHYKKYGIYFHNIFERNGYGTINIGDYIVKSVHNCFEVHSEESFNKKFILSSEGE